eukprot:55098-Alexandrium_andersonii.AAC.1
MSRIKAILGGKQGTRPWMFKRDGDLWAQVDSAVRAKGTHAVQVSKLMSHLGARQEGGHSVTEAQR